MYENPEYNGQGEKILCQENGKNSHMMMDVRVQRLAAGQKLRLLEQEKETAVMLLSGKILYAFEGKREIGERRSVFLDKPCCLHCCRRKEMIVTAQVDSRLLIQQTTNQNGFDTVFYTPQMCTLQEFGKEQWEGTAHRQVLTVFDYENAPWSNMVKPQGFGVGFVGEQCFRVQDQGCLAVTPMQAHQQVAAPGYRMYYAWLIRHLEGDPWRKTRIVDPEHEWLDHSDYE